MIFFFLCVSQIYVVDSVDRDRIGVARKEFQAIVKDPLMLSSVVLVLANKQDMVISDSSKNQTKAPLLASHLCSFFFLGRKAR